MKPEQDRVRMLLTDTVTLLCKNGLVFSRELKIQGTLGITLDNCDVFVVHINECLAEDGLPTTYETTNKYDSEHNPVDSVIVSGRSNTKRTKCLDSVIRRKEHRAESSEVELELISNTALRSSVVQSNEKLSPQQRISEPRIAPSRTEPVIEKFPQLVRTKDTRLKRVKTELVENDYLDNNLDFALREKKEAKSHDSEKRIADSDSGNVYNTSLSVVRNGRSGRKNSDHRTEYSSSSVNRNLSFQTTCDDTYYGYTSGNAGYDATMFLGEDEFQTASQSTYVPKLGDVDVSYDHDVHSVIPTWDNDTNGNSSYEMGSGDNGSMSFHQLSENELALMYRPQRTHRRSLTGIKAYSCTMDGCRRTFHRGSEMYRHQRDKHGSGWIRVARSRDNYLKRIARTSLSLNSRDVPLSTKIS